MGERWASCFNNQRYIKPWMEHGRFKIIVWIFKYTSLYIQLILHTAQPITYVTFQQIHVELTTPIRAPTYTSHPETTPSHHQLSRPICFHLEHWIDTDLDPYGVQNHDVLTGTTEYPSLQWGIQFNIKKIWIGMDSYPSWGWLKQPRARQQQNSEPGGQYLW